MLIYLFGLFVNLVLLNISPIAFDLMDMKLSNTELTMSIVFPNIILVVMYSLGYYASTLIRYREDRSTIVPFFISLIVYEGLLIISSLMYIVFMNKDVLTPIAFLMLLLYANAVGFVKLIIFILLFNNFLFHFMIQRKSENDYEVTE
jgi:hypothetical protein